MSDSKDFVIENGVLKQYNGPGGEVVIPEGVTEIGFCAFRDCAGLTQVTIPESVMKIDVFAFYKCVSLTNVTIPIGVTEVESEAFFECDSLIDVDAAFLQTKEKLPTGIAGLLSGSGGESLAYVLLYQGAKAWQREVQSRIQKQPKLAEGVVSVITRLLAEEKRPKKAEWEQAVDFVLENQEYIGTESLQAFYDVAREKKCPVLANMESDFGLRGRLAAKIGQEVETATQSPENPAERLVSEQWKVTPMVKHLQGMVKQGVRYVDSEELCSKEVLIWLIASARVQTNVNMFCNNRKEILESLKQNVDPIADGLDQTALMEFLETMVFSDTDTELFIPAYCRYADERQMERIIQQVKMWRHAERVQDLFYYSETKVAMRNCDLGTYASMRGTDEETLRDTVLADLGLDQEGKKYYDLGGRTVEARMEEDLTLSLYDPEAGKAVRSMPKKGADPEKYEAAKEDFVRLKKDLRTAVKERVNLLFQRFLDGQEQEGAYWKKIYFQNPMLNQIARLLVWSQNKKTFIMTDHGTADSAGQPYEVGDKPVKVAHPMEMKKEDLEYWQKYFTSHGLKQPFEQVWEPVVDFSAVREDRYQGLTLSANRLRNQGRHGIYYSNYEGISFTDLDLKCYFSDDYWMNENITVTFGKFQVTNPSRAANHVLVRLDRWLAAERVRKDDATVVNVLDSFTLAQVTELLNLAIENQCTNCTAALLEYKNQKFPDFDPMDVFTLD